ncbi:MAG TPA: response regulator [Aggregatilineaceae bacterium]|nr:response regulator [Aggregatilineaceae bacterium]
MKKVLVIDDNEALRLELLNILRLEGYEALGARDGREGVLTAQQHLPDLIISDINMPVLNGFEFIVELRRDARTEHIPVILLSGGSELPYGLQTDAAGYLPKPCTVDEFLAAVKTQIGD